MRLNFLLFVLFYFVLFFYESGESIFCGGSLKFKQKSLKSFYVGRQWVGKKRAASLSVADVAGEEEGAAAAAKQNEAG